MKICIFSALHFTSNADQFDVKFVSKLTLCLEGIYQKVKLLFQNMSLEKQFCFCWNEMARSVDLKKEVLQKYWCLTCISVYFLHLTLVMFFTFWALSLNWTSQLKEFQLCENLKLCWLSSEIQLSFLSSKTPCLSLEFHNMALKLCPAFFQQLSWSISSSNLLMAGELPLQTHLLLHLPLAEDFKSSDMSDT